MATPTVIFPSDALGLLTTVRTDGSLNSASFKLPVFISDTRVLDAGAISDPVKVQPYISSTRWEWMEDVGRLTFWVRFSKGPVAAFAQNWRTTWSMYKRHPHIQPAVIEKVEILSNIEARIWFEKQSEPEFRNESYFLKIENADDGTPTSDWSDDTDHMCFDYATGSYVPCRPEDATLPEHYPPQDIYTEEDPRPPLDGPGSMDYVIVNYPPSDPLWIGGEDEGAILPAILRGIGWEFERIYGVPSTRLSYQVTNDDIPIDLDTQLIGGGQGQLYTESALGFPKENGSFFMSGVEFKYLYTKGPLKEDTVKSYTIPKHIWALANTLDQNGKKLFQAKSFDVFDIWQTDAYTEEPSDKFKFILSFSNALTAPQFGNGDAVKSYLDPGFSGSLLSNFPVGSTYKTGVTATVFGSGDQYLPVGSESYGPNASSPNLQLGDGVGTLYSEGVNYPEAAIQIKSPIAAANLDGETLRFYDALGTNAEYQFDATLAQGSVTAGTPNLIGIQNATTSAQIATALANALTHVTVGLEAKGIWIDVIQDAAGNKYWDDNTGDDYQYIRLLCYRVINGVKQPPGIKKSDVGTTQFVLSSFGSTDYLNVSAFEGGGFMRYDVDFTWASTNVTQAANGVFYGNGGEFHGHTLTVSDANGNSHILTFDATHTKADGTPDENSTKDIISLVFKAMPAWGASTPAGEIMVWRPYAPMVWVFGRINDAINKAVSAGLIKLDPVSTQIDNPEIYYGNLADGPLEMHLDLAYLTPDYEGYPIYPFINGEGNIEIAYTKDGVMNFPDGANELLVPIDWGLSVADGGYGSGITFVAIDWNNHIRSEAGYDSENILQFSPVDLDSVVPLFESTLQAHKGHKKGLSMFVGVEKVDDVIEKEYIPTNEILTLNSKYIGPNFEFEDEDGPWSGLP